METTIPSQPSTKWFQVSWNSPTNCVRMSWNNGNKVILGLFLFFFATRVSKTAFERTKQMYIARSISIESGLISTSSEISGPITSNEPSIQQQFDPPVQDLLASLKIATLAALSGSGRENVTSTAGEVGIGPGEQAQWEEENPCKSREELKLRYKRRKLVENVDIPPELNVLMHEYAKLHGACIRASGNLSSLFLSENSKTGCKFLVAEAGNGLGNRVMWMVSNLMYAILTQRVILIDPRSRIPSLMCEPFLGSSWAAPKEFPFADRRPDLWQSPNDFIAGLDKAKMNGTKVSMSVNAARADDSWGPTNRFYCPTEQDMYSEIRWITLGGCLYFLPKLFAIPVFQPVLESLFKNKTPLTHLVRIAMLPVDSVWAKVRRVEEVYLKHADQLVGVHVRYRGGYEDYQNFHEVANSNVKKCLMDNGILPKTANNNSSRWSLDLLPVTFSKSTESPPLVRFNVLFISSLYSSLYNDLLTIYPQIISSVTPPKERVSLVHLSSEGKQYSTLEIDERAFVEILCLSFSDVLLTSPTSTFSELAHAYGGLKPWIINIHTKESQSKKHVGACRRGKAIDGCYQGASLFYVCPHDPHVDNGQIMKHVPSLKPCEDGSEGVQLVP